jgi:hypothetical protein
MSQGVLAPDWKQLAKSLQYSQSFQAFQAHTKLLMPQECKLFLTLQFGSGLDTFRTCSENLGIAQNLNGTVSPVRVLTQT